MKSSPKSVREASRRKTASVAAQRGESGREEKVFEGLGVSSGIAIGAAYVRETGTVEVPEYCITRDHLSDEINRFRDAVARTRRQIQRLMSKVKDLPAAPAEEISYLPQGPMHTLMGSR